MNWLPLRRQLLEKARESRTRSLKKNCSIGGRKTRSGQGRGLVSWRSRINSGTELIRLMGLPGTVLEWPVPKPISRHLLPPYSFPSLPTCIWFPRDPSHPGRRSFSERVISTFLTLRSPQLTSMDRKQGGGGVT